MPLPCPNHARAQPPRSSRRRSGWCSPASLATCATGPTRRVGSRVSAEQGTSRGGGTGIPAAVLALLGGLYHLVGVAGGAVMLAGDGALGRALLTFLVHLIVAALLLTGGVGL